MLSAISRHRCRGDRSIQDQQIGRGSAAHRARVESTSTDGKRGRTTVSGGGGPKGHDPGWFVEPTIFADVDKPQRCAREESSGRCAPVIRMTTEDEGGVDRQKTPNMARGTCGRAIESMPSKVADASRPARYLFYFPPPPPRCERLRHRPERPIRGREVQRPGREVGPEGISGYYRPSPSTCPSVYGEKQLVAFAVCKRRAEMLARAGLGEPPPCCTCG